MCKYFLIRDNFSLLRSPDQLGEKEPKRIHHNFLQRVTGSQAKLAEATKEFIDSFTWEAPGEAQAQRKSCEISVSRSRRPGRSVTALEATCFCLFAQQPPAFCQRPWMLTAQARRVREVGRRLQKETGECWAHTPAATHGLLQQDSPSLRKPCWGPSSAPDTCSPPERGLLHSLRVPNSSMHSLSFPGTRDRDKAAPPGKYSWHHSSEQNRCKQGPALFFTEMNRKANRRLKPETTQPKWK